MFLGGLHIAKSKIQAEVLGYLVLDCQVVFKLVIILDNLVSVSLELVDERTRTFCFMSLTLSICQIVSTILTRAKGAL